MYFHADRKYNKKNNYICSRNLILRQVEPPSPILTNQSTADQTSEDPLADSIFMIFGTGPDDYMPEHHTVYTYSVRTGLSYVGTPGDFAS